MPLASLYPFERKDYRFSDGQAMNPRAAPALVQQDLVGGPSGRGLSGLLALCSEYAGFPIERPEATFVECGLDSLVLMQIGAELGKRYGVSISLRDLMEKHNSPALLARHMSMHTLPELWEQSPANFPSAPPAPRMDARERPRLVGGTGTFRRPLLRARRQQPLREGAFRILGIGRDDAWYYFDKHSQQYAQLK